jgi:hypothetical protein
MIAPQVNWQQVETDAKLLSMKELNGKVRDILSMLDQLDGFDRAHGTDVAGYFRDMISVYRNEVKRRKGG